MVYLQYRPDRYVPVFGEFSYDYSKWRPSSPFVEQLKAFQDLIDEGKVTGCYTFNDLYLPYVLNTYIMALFFG